MEWKNEDSDLLEAYARGELSEEERTAFELRLAGDLNLAAEAKLVAEILSGIKARGRAESKAELREIWEAVKADGQVNGKEEEGEKPELPPSRETGNSLRRRSRFLRIAATILILAVLGTLLYNYFGESRLDRIYTALYSPYPPVPLVRQTGDDYEAGMLAYQKGNYPEASDMFQIELGTDSLDAIRYLYLGNCKMNLGEFENAIECFRQSTELGNENHGEHAYWFMALSYLKLGEEDFARKVFVEIAGEGGVYAARGQRAVEMLE